MNKIVIHKGLTILEVKNPCLAEELKDSPVFNHFVLKNLSNGRFLIRKPDEKTLLEELARKGCVPKIAE